MPFAQMLTHYCPSILLATLMACGAVGASVVGILLVRRIVPHQKLKSHNDIAGAIFNTLGVAYAVLLAFVVVIVWQGFDKARTNVDDEANYVIDLVRDASGLSEDFRREVIPLAGEYVRGVIDDEWAAIARGERSPRVQETAKRLVELYASYEPKTESEKVFYAESVHKLNDMLELRHLRVVASKNGLHDVLWLVLLIGAAVTISFPLFFGSENLRSQILMTSLLSIVIALILFLILAYDYPFTGDVRITPAAFQEALQLGKEIFWQAK